MMYNTLYIIKNLLVCLILADKFKFINKFNIAGKIIFRYPEAFELYF